MTELHHCDHCGSDSTIYTHSIGKGITLALLKFKRAVIYHDRNSIHPVKDMDGHAFELTKNQRANWTMLRYHGLVAKDEKAGKGYWLLTNRGRDFLNGTAVPAKVRVLNNEVQHDREPDGQYYVTIDEVLNDEARSWYSEIEHLEREAVPLETVQGSFGFDIPTPPQRDMRAI